MGCATTERRHSKCETAAATSRTRPQGSPCFGLRTHRWFSRRIRYGPRSKPSLSGLRVTRRPETRLSHMAVAARRDRWLAVPLVAIVFVAGVWVAGGLI